MGYIRGFNFDNYIPTYPSEEAMLTDYLRDIHDVVSYDVYRAIFDSLLKNDKKALAYFLIRAFTSAKEARDDIRHTKEKIDKLENEVEQLKDSENKLERENAKLRLKLKDVYKSEAGLDLRIRDMYVEEKKSLREIAEIIGKDKKTVKKHLEKMEAYERKAKEEEEEVLKMLTQHLPKL